MCGKNHGFKRIITGNLRFMRINFYAYLRSSLPDRPGRFVDRITRGGEGYPTCTHNGKGYSLPPRGTIRAGHGSGPGKFPLFFRKSENTFIQSFKKAEWDIFDGDVSGNRLIPKGGIIGVSLFLTGVKCRYIFMVQRGIAHKTFGKIGVCEEQSPECDQVREAVFNRLFPLFLSYPPFRISVPSNFLRMSGAISASGFIAPSLPPTGSTR